MDIRLEECLASMGPGYYKIELWIGIYTSSKIYKHVRRAVRLS